MKHLSKKVWIPILVVVSILLIAAIIYPIIYFNVLYVDLKISATQVGESAQIDVDWDTSKDVDKVSISVYHGKNLISQTTTENVADLVAGHKVVEGVYGKTKVEVKIQRGVYSTTKSKQVNLSASEYNIAPITATMPVTIFSLELSEITDNGRIPTFVWFKRSGAWDWGQLPENVYPMPTAESANQFLNSGEETMYEKTTAYVKELYSINNQSKFHLYYNDYFDYGWVQATIANGIPKDNYNVVLLSDGTASFKYFNQHFDNPETADANYEKMVEDWETLKTQVANKKEYNKKTKAIIDTNTLREYAFVMANEEDNVEWWLTRVSGTLAINNQTFYDTNINNNASIKVKDLNTLLNAIKNGGEDQYLTTEGLKELYNFSDDMFEKAAEENKDVMVILGTWTQDENSDRFDLYVKATMKYYGDDYVYYYKGHPRNPTNSVEGKLEKLTNLGLIDVDSTIPAELIFFFNPDAYCTGYQSTTFVSLDDEHSCGVFKETKAAFNQEYKNRLDFFMSRPGENLTEITPNEECVLIEFSNTTEYEIAIYNGADNTIKYYKNVEGSYQEVK